jgi:hypothetical protein
MNTRACLFTVVAIVLLSACAAQREARHAESVKQFCEEQYADTRIDPLRGKMLIPISVNEAQPIEMLANRQRPDAAEREAILALSQARNACNKYAFEKLGAPPAYRSATHDRVSAELADLYAGDISFGEFAKALLYIGERDKLASEDIEQAIRERERWKDVEYSN